MVFLHLEETVLSRALISCSLSQNLCVLGILKALSSVHRRDLGPRTPPYTMLNKQGPCVCLALM